MKKWIIPLLAVVLLLQGCTDQGANAKEVTDTVLRRKMLRLLTLIPEKKSLYLAQMAMSCRNIEKVMDMFAKINVSPVTISKRHEIKYLKYH